MRDNDSILSRLVRVRSLLNGSGTYVVAVSILLLVLGGLVAPALAQSQTDPAEAQKAPQSTDDPYPRRVAAPELEGGEWVNVETPLHLSSLRGRFVLLDFWTFCCINCMHVLPELKILEHTYPNELAVIGIHSAKFAGEQSTDNIRAAVERYEIEHPVVNDAKMAIWTRYGARSWPTLVLIDPAGDVVWAASGERTAEEIKSVIERGLPYYRANGALKPSPRPGVTRLGGSNERGAALRFPGKVLADSSGGRLFVADSNHNRIVVCSFDGRVQDVIGGEDVGRDDGGFDSCRFNHPQGMALVGGALYVADTENHLLRKVDLRNKTVTTVAGTGTMGRGRDVRGGSSTADALRVANDGTRLLTVPLSSPWALWPQGKNLYIAMAGTHQIWIMPLDESSIAPYAGNGREDIADGPLLPQIPYQEGFASFAQPSGLSSDGRVLFVADSEGSTVRVVPFEGDGKVATLVGLTRTLFDFGDLDGTGPEVRLQHPLDVAWADGQLYVADTYNNKIKVIDPQRRTCQTVAGSGQAGKNDGSDGRHAVFNEPGGISAANGKLYVADTNNHVIRIVELSPPYAVSTLLIDATNALIKPPSAK